MKRRSVVLVLAALVVATAAFAQKNSNPFLGRWDFNLTQGNATRAIWLGVKQADAGVEVWYQPTGGNVYKVKDFKIEGSHLSVTLSPAGTNRQGGVRPAQMLELDAAGDKLTGAIKNGERSTPVTAVRAPELKRAEPKAWTKPEPLFNGKDLSGWEPIGNPANSHWVVEDGLLVNKEHGANLKSTRQFEDFKLHFEVNCPDRANSGFYLRGRYEVQLEYEPEGSEPPERAMGSIYGRIPPKATPRMVGQWESFDVTLVGRTVTIVRNGVTTVDHQEIDGITGGALDANEGEPGPFYIQGDHTGGLKFRNITISLPRK